MKKLLTIALVIFSMSSFAQGFANATMEELSVLTKYIMEHSGRDATFAQTLDDEDFSVSEFMYKGEVLKLITVYSGDTANGPIYNPKTLEIVGEMGDGDFKIRGQWVDAEDLVYDLSDTLVDVLVDDFFCGEMDPFVVGDVCILFVSYGDKKTAVLFDFDSLADVDVDALAGKKARLNTKRLTKLYDRDTLEVLVDYDSSYFYMGTYFTLEEVLTY